MKLGRGVALKVLPASFTNDPERVARFRREVQVLASLNHPHIAQIYGLEESNGTQFIVLELVDGESFDKRIAHVKNEDPAKLWVTPPDPHPNGYANGLFATCLFPFVRQLIERITSQFPNSPYASVSGRPFSEYSAEQIAKQVELNFVAGTGTRLKTTPTRSLT